MAAKRLVKESIGCLTKANLMRGRIGSFSSSSTTTTTAPPPPLLKKLLGFSSAAGGGSLSSNPSKGIGSLFSAGMQTSEVGLPSRLISSRLICYSDEDRMPDLDPSDKDFMKKSRERLEEHWRKTSEIHDKQLDNALKVSVYDLMWATPPSLAIVYTVYLLGLWISSIPPRPLPKTSSELALKNLVADEK